MCSARDKRTADWLLCVTSLQRGFRSSPSLLPVGLAPCSCVFTELAGLHTCLHPGRERPAPLALLSVSLPEAAWCMPTVCQPSVASRFTCPFLLLCFLFLLQGPSMTTGHPRTTDPLLITDLPRMTMGPHCMTWGHRPPMGLDTGSHHRGVGGPHLMDTHHQQDQVRCGFSMLLLVFITPRMVQFEVQLLGVFGMLAAFGPSGRWRRPFPPVWESSFRRKLLC